MLRTRKQLPFAALSWRKKAQCSSDAHNPSALEKDDTSPRQWAWVLVPVLIWFSFWALRVPTPNAQEQLMASD